MKQIWILLITLLPSIHILGQNTIGLPLIINYSKTEFHGGAQTWDIKQDKNGVMYFANNEGLVSFDGTNWKVHPLPNKTIMRSLAIDKNNRIYAGGQGEMGYFIADVNGFLRYESLISLLPKAQNKFADIWDIVLQGESVFFRATDKIFELKNNNIQFYLPKSEWQFLKLSGKRLIAQDKINGLFQYRNNTWIPFRNNKLLDHQIVAGVTQIGEDSSIITTMRKNFFLLTSDSIMPLRSYPEIKEDIKNALIYRTEKLNNKEFVAGTTSEGCLIMNINGKLIQKISRTEGLQDNNVLCAYLDRDNNLWTGLNNGISMIAYNSALKYIRPNKTNELSGFSSSIFKNNLYIGTSDGAYVTSISNDYKDLSFSKGEFTLIKNSSGQVWRLQEVNQKLLMGHNSGTFTIQNNEATQVSTQASWIYVPLSSVYPAPNILAGTYTGLKMFEFNNSSFTDKGDLKGTYESFRFLAVDNNNTVWASHPYRGIYKIELTSNQKEYNAQLYTEKDGLPSSLNNHVFKIKNRIVFATEKGVYEYNSSTNKFAPSPSLQPVFGNTELRYLNEDEDGNIWFCSGKKIGVVHFTDPSSTKFNTTYFPELTGQILSGFENIFPYNNENVFIGSEKGIIHLNYKKYINTKVKLSLLLSSVKSIGKSDSSIFGGYTQVNSNNLSNSGNITPLHFPIRANSFHFEFSSPIFGSKNNIEYSYKLNGFDKEWSIWSAKAEKDYNNLSNGTYTFQVKAHDNLGNESKVITYEFIINPPFYKTIWAYLFYLILFILLLYFLYKWQKKSLHLQQLKYEEKQKQIIALHNLEIEKNEKEIIKLQNEKLANEILLKKQELANASMHLVEREDALARVKDELLKLYKKTGNNHDVKIALQLLNGIEKNKSNWEQFASHLDEVNNDFLKKLKSRYPELTNSDLKVCAYLQLNLSSKEIAQLMNISVRGVEISRYRLRKKLGIKKEQSLNDFFNKIS